MSTRYDDTNTDFGGGEGEATGKSEGGGTTVALQKKRLRRVSFAEMTLVRFFDLDEEDKETPREGDLAARDGNDSAVINDLLGLSQSEDSKGEEEGDGEGGESDDEELVMRRSFLRPIESPSPGSGFGSATSNDEDNYFGPVSASFIRPDRLSDSGVSDDNHDVTMDSTAFSMHFRSLARSDSGVDLKTPTGIHLSFEEKLSTHNVGSSMELTVPKKLTSNFSSPTVKRSGSSSSSDMSLVGESPSRYNYGKLSPGLDALLVEGNQDFGVISDSNNIFALETPIHSGDVFSPSRENSSCFIDDTNNRKTDSLQEKSGEANGHEHMRHDSPLAELTSSSPAKQRKVFKSNVSPLKCISDVFPQEQRDSSPHKDDIKYHGTASSILKSISKLKLLEASPFSASLTSKMENLNVRPLNFPKSSPFNILLEREMKSFQTKHLDASSTGTDSQLLIAYPKKGTQISTFSTDNNDVQVTVSMEHINLSEESNASAVLPFQFIEGKLSTSTPEQLVSSLDNWSRKKLKASAKTLDSNDLVADQFVKVQKYYLSGRSSASKETAINVNLSTAPFEKPGSFSMGTSTHLGSPVVEVHGSNLCEVNAKGDKDINNLDKQSGYEIIENLRIPTKMKVLQLTDTEKLEGSLRAGVDISRSKSKLSLGELESASGFVPSVRRKLKELKFEYAKDLFPQSAPTIDFQIVGKEHLNLPHTVDLLSPGSNQLKPPLKRRNKVLALDDIEHRNDVAAQQKNSKLQKVVDQDVQTHGRHNEDSREAFVMAHGSKLWTDLHSKFSEDAERLLPSSIDKLDISVIGLFEDVLCNLKKSKTYGMLCNEIFPQKASALNDLRSERLGETRLLLHQIMHEKAKSQLMHAKKKRLVGKLQILSSGIQELQRLNMNALPNFQGGSEVGVVGLPSFIRMKQKDQDDKVTAMKQALETLERNKAIFIKSLQSFCKMKGEPSCSECILLADDFLMKKSRHRFIHLSMQMWIVDDVKSMDGHYIIFLNYLDFIIQSFKFTSCPASTFVLSNKVDDVSIMKNFPNMDACKAFSFVLNAEITQKYVGSRSLAQEAQVTSSLIGNLVDVVRELQLARLQLRNLTQAFFHCPLAGELNLQLSFICFKRGKKISLILDMSCLNRAIYPSDILPSQLTASLGRSKSVGEPIIDEIRDAVKSLRAGYMRILRLCMCISLVVQGSTK